jgi:hypothetical protein
MIHQGAAQGNPSFPVPSDRSGQRVMIGIAFFSFQRYFPKQNALGAAIF